MEAGGFTEFLYLRINGPGMEKTKLPVTEEGIARVVERRVPCLANRRLTADRLTRGRRSSARRTNV